MKSILKKNKKNVLWLIAVMLCLMIVEFIGHPGFLRSYISMYPTFEASDVLFVNKFAYRLKSPKLGDVILSIERSEETRDMPKDRFVKLIHPFYWSKKNYIIIMAPSKPTNVKRIIGMPGETIELINKQVFINGEKYAHGSEIFIEENQFPIEYDFDTRVNMPAVQIPAGYYFLLGDHRDLSRDSRVFGPVHKDDIRGKISMLIYSRRNDQIRWFKKIN